MRKLLIVVAIFLLSILFLVLLFNASTNTSKQTQIVSLSNLPTYPDAAYRLAKILATPKDSLSEPVFFSQLYPKLQEYYPNIFNDPNVEWQILDGNNLVIKWIGRTPELAPLLLVANQYEALPSIPKIDTNYIYYQGVSNKHFTLFAMLEAFQHLIKNNTLSNRTIYFAFPQDNDEGELVLLKALQEAKINPEFIIKMGGGLCENKLWDISSKVGLIGIGHQAIVQINLETTSPKPELVFEQARQQLLPALPAFSMEQPVLNDFLEYITPELGFGQRFFFSNQWLFNNIIQKRLQNNPLTQELFGNSFHIAPPATDSSGKSLTTLSFLSPTPKKDLEKWVKTHLKHPQIQLLGQAHIIQPTSPIAPTQHHGYRAISNSSKEIFPDLLTAPILVTENSTINWQAHTQSPIYYFQPNFYNIDNQEKISQKSYLQMIQFYQRLLLNNI